MKFVDPRPILIVEDSDEDYEATEWAIRRASFEIPILRCRDGEQAIDYLERRGRLGDRRINNLPALILLDLNLPRTDGFQVLEHIKAADHLKTMPVVVVTTSARPSDIEKCYRYGANSFFQKPVNMIRLREMVQRLIEYWFLLVLLPKEAED